MTLPPKSLVKPISGELVPTSIVEEKPKSKGFLDEVIDEPAKILLIGDSGVGKTGSLASLVAAGYKLHILDLDSGIPILRNALGSPKSPYTKWLADKGIDVNERVFAKTLTEKMRVSGGVIAPATARVWDQATMALENFNVGDHKLGNIGNWGLDTVLVIDSLTILGFAALWNVQALNQRLGSPFSGYDWQRDVGTAQNNMERLLQLLYSKAVGCHVIVISHITFIDDSKGVAVAPSRDPDAPNIQVKGYPSAIGRALSQRLGRYFNDVFQIDLQGSGVSARRYIYTLPPSNIIVKSSSPYNLKNKYPIETGLAEIFAQLRGQPEPADMLKRAETEQWHKFTSKKE